MITLSILLAFTFVIFVHELGHFLVARWVGVKVYTFSVGIGPKLVRVFKDRQGTEYIISWIPLGGYVRMKGQEDIPTKNGEKKSDDHYLAKSPAQRFMIIIAGVSMNLLSAYFMIVLAYSIGVNFTSNKIGGFNSSLLAASNPFKTGDEIIEVAGVPTPTFEEVLAQVAFQEGDDVPLKIIRDQKEIEILAPLVRSIDDQAFSIPHLGIIPERIPVVKNLDHQSSLYLIHHLRDGDTIKYLKTGDGEKRNSLQGILNYVKSHPGREVKLAVVKKGTADSQHQIIENVKIGIREVKEKGFTLSLKVKVLEGYPAQKAGLQDGDVVLQVNGFSVDGWEEIVSQLKPSQDGTVEIKVKRADQEIDYLIKPLFDSNAEKYLIGISLYQDPEQKGSEVASISQAMSRLIPGIREGDKIVSLQPDGKMMQVRVIREGHQIDFSYDTSKLLKTEMGFLFELEPRGKVISYSWIDSFGHSIPITVKEFKEVVLMFSQLLKGNIPLKEISGPISVFEVSHYVAANRGWSYFILLFAKISISLAFINILPIPVLDGGHLVLILYEIIRGKPLSENLVRGMQFVGVLLLITLMIYVNYNDISRLINR